MTPLEAFQDILDDYNRPEWAQRPAAEILPLIAVVEAALSPRVVTREQVESAWEAGEFDTPDQIVQELARLGALSPRVVTTAAELDALTDGTIVLDGWMQDRDAWRRDVGYWWSTSRADRDGFGSNHLADMGPVTVLWTPPQPDADS